MCRIAIAVVIALALASCDAVNTVTEGFAHAKAVENDLEGSIGIRPQVGFNWNNGRLVSVTVTFPRLYDAKPLSDLAVSAREAVEKEFQQKPDAILLTFALRE